MTHAHDHSRKEQIMDMDVQKLVPDQHVWLTINNTAGEPQYIITSQSEYDRREYHIYVIKGDKVKLLGSGPSPKELEDKYVKIDKLFG